MDTNTGPVETERPQVGQPRRSARLAVAVAALGIAGAMLALNAAGGQSAAPAPQATPKVGLAAQQLNGLGLPAGIIPAGVQAVPAAAPVGAAPNAAAPNAQAQPQAAPAASAASGSTVRVEIMNYQYSPASPTVDVGDTVVWTNHDSAPHTVTIDSGPDKFSSPNIAQGQSFSYTFTKAGSYTYYCAVHPDMKAALTVTGGGTTPPTSTTTAPPTSGGTTPPPPPVGDCVAKAELATLWQHLQAAHLEEPLTQQVGDILNLGQYVSSHLVLVEHLLTPLVNGGGIVQQPLLTFWQHLQAAHLDEPLTQQIGDILNPTQYVSSHLVLVEHMLEPVVNQLTC
ncbi:cupredoxin domain-containing protein [Solihabitans fulvus]|uniref:cupredoxin domain-containing protein n=1 Tax=Solihabitans fulvus TaxID=1892852 RepID=UPI001CB768F8|nr:cupredoxin family copper-binding protein [Solihabitans fulvus]